MFFFLLFFSSRERLGVGRRKKRRIERKRREGGRQMTCLSVKAGNCPTCQPIVYQRGGNTYSSYYSLPEASVRLPLIPSSGTSASARQCFSITVVNTHTHTHTRALGIIYRREREDLSAPLGEAAEETPSLLEHVRRIRRPRRAPKYTNHLLVA